MKRIPKDNLITFSLDAPTVRLIEEMAEAEFDRNRSLTIRRAVAEAAERRGINAQVEGVEVGHALAEAVA